ncbi:MAG: TetR/AcrR family transcriptional regulator [Pseudomonadota bacterium]
MRYSSEHKQKTRASILAAAGQLFRKEGYGGSGIDGLTKAAGVTNGAFYGHFRSKGEAFRAAVASGLEELRLAVGQLKADGGRSWLKNFVDIYLGAKRTCDLGESCALPSLSPDVIRADTETRAAYEAELKLLIADVADGLDGPDPQRNDDAIALLSLLTGGVTLARAVHDPALAERIAAVVKRRALEMTAHRNTA